MASGVFNGFSLKLTLIMCGGWFRFCCHLHIDTELGDTESSDTKFSASFFLYASIPLCHCVDIERGFLIKIPTLRLTSVESVGLILRMFIFKSLLTWPPLYPLK